MERMYNPWRDAYTSTVDSKKQDPSAKACVFCKQFDAMDDKKYFILGRYKHNVVMLNLYPYNAGHLLILPLAHKARLDTLTKPARAELMELTSKSMEILEKVLKCEGINVGINMGKPAGGSIAHHLHIHVLPRWQGDTNFLPALADTKTISFDITKIYTSLLPAFKKLKL